MNMEFIEAIEALEREKGISKDVLIDAIESAPERPPGEITPTRIEYGISELIRKVNLR